MAYATDKAMLYGAVLTIGMFAGLYLLKRDEIAMEYIALQSVLTGVLAGLIFGWIMRRVTVELPGQSVEQIESALDGAWQLRGFKREAGNGDHVAFARGKGMFGDRIVVTPTATGVTMEGPANLLRVWQRKAAA